MTTSALRKQFQVSVDHVDAPIDRARRLLQQLLTGSAPRTADGALAVAHPRPARRTLRGHHDVAYRHDDGGSGDDGGWD